MSDDRQWFRHSLRCRACANRFHVDRLTADPDKVRPKCPKCGGKTKESFMADVGMDVSAGKAPGVVGSISAKAFDAAHEIAMADHGMTDIRSDARPGENSVPRLPQHLQNQVDGFWQGGQKPKTRTGRVDLSPIFGERANQPGAQQPSGTKFTADAPSSIAPILNHKPAGSSPVPAHTVVAG
jgi:hypothetical protein